MSNKFQYKEEAIPLVAYDPNTSKYELNDEALHFIQSVPGPIGVVGVAGMYRTGKSYLLNQMLLNRSDGFGVGPTVNPCTKGIWVWGKPLLGTTADGQNVNIIIIDSEGIGALDEDSSHDSRIFALAVLLSSCFIYNSVGSIDESAIQNLSLIVNLTKNIQLKSKNSQSISQDGDDEEEDFDQEEFAQLFPAFLWVVRDFSLQLVDEEGESLQAKEYLEKALAPQKGFTESVEQKNRIRRCLTTFFRERDCHTLVRPLTNEENLQNLDKLSFDQLRPEFFEQVITMRKSILTKMKIKKMQGQNLNGEMFAGLIDSYVSAINNGAVPNIENAWTYLCQAECQKSLQRGLEHYDTVIRDILHNKLPMLSEDLKEYHKIAKQQTIQNFKEKAVGQSDIVEQYQKELVQKMKQKFQVINSENEKESQRVCENFIQVEFQAIEKKLKMNEYGTNISEFQDDLQLFKEYFMERGPKTANKKIFFSTFQNRVLSEASSYFLRTANQKYDIDATLTQEQNKKLQSEITELTETIDQIKKESQNKIYELQREKSEIEIKEQILMENITEVKSENQRLDKELKETAQQDKMQYQKEMSQLRMLQAQSEEKSKEIERKMILQQSEFEKEKALMCQKIQYFEKYQEEQNQKENLQSQDFKNVKKDMQQQVKEQVAKYESQIKTMNSLVNELQEKIQDLESDLIQKDQDFDIEKRKLEIQIENQNFTIQEKDANNQTLESEINKLKEKYDKQEILMSNSKESGALEQRIQEIELLLKEKEENLGNIKSQSEKDKALLHQKIEFLEVQNKENLQQLEENKRAHDAIMAAFENSNSQDKQEGKNLDDARIQHANEIKALQAQYEQNKQRLLEQIEILQEKNNDDELQSKFTDADLTQKIEELQEKLDDQTQQIEKLETLNEELQQERAQIGFNTEERFLGKIKELEEENEEIKNKTREEIKEIQAKSEQSLAQLKNLYEIERECLEKRINEERDKCQKKLHQANEEFFENKRAEQQNYEEEIENLKEDLREQENNYHQFVSQYQHDIALKEQSIETLEKHIQETKENMQQLQNNNNSSLQSHMNNFSEERRQLMERIDNLNRENQNKEKENISLAQKKEHLESTLSRREASLASLKEQMAAEREELNKKIESLKQQLQQSGDQFLDYKIETSKEIALSNQKNEFMNKKNEDLQQQNENLVNRYEDKIKLLIQENAIDVHEKVQKIEEEKNYLETKYEKAKTTLKEIEGTYNKQLSQLEKEKAIISEKLQNLESKKAEIEGKYSYDIEYIQKQNQELKENQAFERKQYKSELDKYKNASFALEQEKNDITMNYDRDKALWESKQQFLEQQKEQAKHDLADALKKFEITLQHLQKARSNEKSDHDSTLNELLISMEKKYQNQINEINETNQKVVQEYEEKLRRLQKELKQFKEQQYIQKYGQNGQQNVLNEKKLSEFMETQRKLQQEIDQLKQEREIKNMEFQKVLDKERENYKIKINDIERKYRDSEQKRSQMIFEFEKEKAKWNLDKDHLIVQKNELLDQCEKLEKKKEIMLRENEKLRNDNKISRRSINLLGQGLSSNLLLKSKKSPENKLQDITQNQSNLDISQQYQKNPKSNIQTGIIQYDPKNQNMKNNNSYMMNQSHFTSNNSMMDQ